MKRLIFSLLFLFAGSATAQVQGVELEEPVTLPEFMFTNELDETFTDDNLHDVWTIIMFGFLTCCLLYTSPSPRDKRQSRMPSSA